MPCDCVPHLNVELLPASVRLFVIESVRAVIEFGKDTVPEVLEPTLMVPTVIALEAIVAETVAVAVELVVPIYCQVTAPSVILEAVPLGPPELAEVPVPVIGAIQVYKLVPLLTTLP